MLWWLSNGTLDVKPVVLSFSFSLFLSTPGSWRQGFILPSYLTVTIAVALPPALLLTVILCGLVGQENLPEYFLPFLVNVPMSVSVEVT